MILKEITKKTFKNFADKHEQITFHQTSEWANLKSGNGWNSYYLGLYDKNKLQAVTLLLSKELPFIKKRMFYSPRGFLIDYYNKDLLKIFTKEVSSFIKANKGIFLKIDPYVQYQQRDNNGDIVSDGFNHHIAVENLTSLGFKHFGFNKMQDTLQPRWLHVIDTENRSLDDVMKDMDSKTRQILRKNEKCGITTREITKEELPIFKDIMQHTSERREFIDRPLSYYEQMWDSLHDSGILKIYLSTINFTTYKKNVDNDLKQLREEIDDRTHKKENNLLKMNEKKYQTKQEQDKKEIERLMKLRTEIDEYIEQYGTKVTLGGIMFLIYENEVLSLFGGSDARLMNFQSAYTLHFEGIKLAVNGHYKKYNFYGITGDFRKENPLYGLYLFKKSFGGNVEELIGEFDLIISPLWYKIYQFLFTVYTKLKNKKN